MLIRLIKRRQLSLVAGAEREQAVKALRAQRDEIGEIKLFIISNHSYLFELVVVKPLTGA